ncbi:MAG: ribonuclease P protein component [Cyanobacteria bacterium K_DeepCast_35m_m2_155]|nr:ribonuclease P protein component [Cyanobacteria bacterium K_DeepCast_35m_m2_155]
MALPLAHRLKGQRVFDALYRRGRAFHGSAMVLRCLPADPVLLPPTLSSKPVSSWRCGVVVSSKVHKRAVRRNRLRRSLHQGLQTLLPASAATADASAQKGFETPIWLLISLKPGSESWEPDRLLGECRHLLAKAGLIV